MQKLNRAIVSRAIGCDMDVWNYGDGFKWKHIGIPVRIDSLRVFVPKYPRI